MNYFFNEIWGNIWKAVTDVRIYLVGPNPPKEFFRLANSENIIITGGVPDVRPYIQKATVCIAPLITGAGLRGKVIEYAALKRTFVATSIAMTDLAYKDGSDYMKADTASVFSQKVISLLEDDKLRQKMTISAYKTTQKNYDTRRLVNFLYRLYDHLIMK
jgi:glycosyltransferase involved in cell wall biosynthesis